MTQRFYSTGLRPLFRSLAGCTAARKATAVHSRIYIPEVGSKPCSQPRYAFQLFPWLQSQQCFFSTANPRRAAPSQPSEPTELSSGEYHKQSDAYIDSLVESLEEMAEQKEEIDVEYHSGVLNLVFPPAGTYVINKQPPNRQIWLSSPISGPKRYDYVVNDSGRGEWVYLRDGSTLTNLLNDELKLGFEAPEVD